ncbi:hypothetical protein LT330_009185 [Penicillium expansum]|uniref:Phytanoyl-CoA dioxygenase n=1 Tax=Penicillium expansum TaxID=27334 RepID=A0A0A2IFH0_PENEN|nr:hypothetical protein PEX2_107200 [Penicillium expansum]KAK4865752.1 hypothetical protein LT330_009185 [Penicillium expansum]KGO41809.1 hypothetical protein PEXP_108150 [Penicillium expansum]KGO52061.1 hypothetical protein PEX2_107200 [Penicillium expansum]
MPAKLKYKLSQEQIDHFMKYGYVRLPDCFSREKAAEWAGDVWTRLGVSPTNKSTWTTEITHMGDTKEEAVSTFSPKAWAAICELLGGEDRVAPESATWNDALIVNLGSPESEGTWPHPADLPGWHVDGDFFTHFLDSPEQALLVIPLFTDIQDRAGGTMVCPEAMKYVAQHLYKHPEGVTPYMYPRGQEPVGDPTETPFYSDIVKNCNDFHQMTGKVGDVVLLHPLMCHSISVNSLRHPRVITNPPVALKQPFKFDRDDPSKYSLVEKKTLEMLGKDRLSGWKIKGRREFVVPERLKDTSGSSES